MPKWLLLLTQAFADALATATARACPTAVTLPLQESLTAAVTDSLTDFLSSVKEPDLAVASPFTTESMARSTSAVQSGKQI